MTEEKENCNFQQNYNVFGLDDKPCCYLYHKYCDEIDSCYFKRCKRLEQENKELKENLLDKYSPRYYDIVPKRQTVELYKKFDDLRNQNNTYRSALEEIKAIINQSCDNCKHNKDSITCSIGDCGEGKLKIIENKINNVLGNSRSYTSEGDINE